MSKSFFKGESILVKQWVVCPEPCQPYLSIAHSRVLMSTVLKLHPAENIVPEIGNLYSVPVMSLSTSEPIICIHWSNFSFLTIEIELILLILLSSLNCFVEKIR